MLLWWNEDNNHKGWNIRRKKKTIKEICNATRNACLSAAACRTLKKTKKISPHAVSCFSKDRLKVPSRIVPLISSWTHSGKGGLYVVPQQMSASFILSFGELSWWMKTVSVYYCEEPSLRRTCWPTQEGITSKLNESTNGHQPPLPPCSRDTAQVVEVTTSFSAHWQSPSEIFRDFQQVSSSHHGS